MAIMPTNEMDDVYAKVVATIQKAARMKPDQRILVAVAGPPGCGKSTIAAKAVDMLNASANKPRNRRRRLDKEAVVVSVDGFHYPRSYLDALPNRAEAYIRRGAPWTFDVQGILTFIRALKKSASLPREDRPAVYAPSFDHAAKDPVADDICIPPRAQIVILEHNYLLLDESDWREISGMVDVRIFVDVDASVARNRVARRHVLAGIEDTLVKGQRRFDLNDGPNGELIRRNLVQCDLVVRSIDTGAANPA